MSNPLDLSTPPPFTICTPHTPQFGFYDNFNPYSPRRSARIAQRHLLYQKTVATSPGDFHTDRTSQKTPVNLDKSNSVIFQLPSPKLAKTHDTVKSGPRTSRKKKYSASTLETSIDAAQSLSVENSNKFTVTVHKNSSPVRQNEMLPTPAKTPVKRPQKPSSSITSIARNLFPVQPSKVNGQILTPKRKGHTKINSGRVAVFTDPHDRVPEKDFCPDNPFYYDSISNLSNLKRQSNKRKKIMVPGEGMQSTEDLEKRNDGLLYVFRGKKVWRKFSEDSEDDDIETNDNEANDEEYNLHKPLTRSSVKPRLLFSRNSHAQRPEVDSHNTDDEEADTDIEDSALLNSKFRSEEVVSTPKTSIFVPASPPTTARVTRLKKLDPKICPEPDIYHENSGTSNDRSRSTREYSPSCASHYKLRSIVASKKRDGDHNIGPIKKIKLR